MGLSSLSIKAKIGLNFSIVGLELACSNRAWDLLLNGPQKGPAERGHVKKSQKSSKSVKNIFRRFSTFFRAGQKKSKIVKKCQNSFRHVSTTFARHQFPAPFEGPVGSIFQRNRDVHKSFCPQRLGRQPPLRGQVSNALSLSAPNLCDCDCDGHPAMLERHRCVVTLGK